MVTVDVSTPLTTELRRLGTRPFGVDDDGKPIRDGTGRLIVGAIRVFVKKNA